MSSLIFPLLRLHSRYFLRICSHKRSYFHEPYKSGDKKYEEEEKDDISTLSRIKSGIQILKGEIALWKEEMKENMKLDPKLYVPGDTEMVWKFNNEADLKKWIVTSDKSNHDGYSDCELVLTKYNHGLFRGVLDKRLPKDGRVVRTGYCNMTLPAPRKSFKTERFFEWEAFTHLVMRVRGDGRSYALILQSGGYFDVNWHDTYTFILYTRGGPYWQFAKIPFSRFFLTTKGRIQDKQAPTDLTRIKGLGITCADRGEGPFHLEIDYIGLHWDNNHTEEFAYEMYHHPRSGLY